MSDSLFEPKHEDGFKTESPLRAFTTFDNQGRYAIGKGFRPSMAHLARYLDAIEDKEGWRLVQILIGDNDPTLIFHKLDTVSINVIPSRLHRPGHWGDGHTPDYVEIDFIDMPDTNNYAEFRDRLTRQIAESLGIDYESLSADFKAMEEPTICKHEATVEHALGDGTPVTFCPDCGRNIAVDGDPITCRHEKIIDLIQFGKADPVNRVCADCGMAFGAPEPEDKDIYSNVVPIIDETGTAVAGAGPLRKTGKAAVLGASYGVEEVMIDDDPINPAHYGGDHCAQIGEILTANSYQVLKYNWRLGKKDDICQELGKSLWYLDREIALFETHDLVLAKLPSDEWLAERLTGCSDHTTYVAVQLWTWNQTGRIDVLRTLRSRIEHEKMIYECCMTGLAID